MSLHPVSAQEAIARMAIPLGQPGGFSAIIDARSQDEFELDHLPGAVNWPSLDNAQRIEVGTLYKQVNAFEAQKRGAALVAANIARHIEQHVMDLPKSWQPLIYCWRGGKRSGSLSLILGQIGFKVAIMEGGYKAFRSAMVASIPALALRLNWRVVCGPTGSGKTRLLQCLIHEGAQVAIGLARQPDLGEDRDVEAEFRRRELGMVAADDPGLLQRAHPAQTGRRRQTDLTRQFDIAHAPIRLQRGEDLTIDLVEFRARHGRSPLGSGRQE